MPVKKLGNSENCGVLKKGRNKPEHQMLHTKNTKKETRTTCPNLDKNEKQHRKNTTTKRGALKLGPPHKKTPLDLKRWKYG